MFSKKNRYSQLIKYIKKFEVNSSSLSELKKEFERMSYSQLRIIKSEIITKYERKKRELSTVTVVVACLSFVLTIYFNGMKELSRGMGLERFMTLIVVLVALFVGMIVFFNMSILNRKITDFTFFEELITEIIAKRDVWDSVHAEAYIEYQNFLREKNSKFLL